MPSALTLSKRERCYLASLLSGQGPARLATQICVASTFQGFDTTSTTTCDPKGSSFSRSGTLVAGLRQRFSNDAPTLDCSGPAPAGVARLPGD
jgi:hypothetical protein